jgi:hypothetical protein
MSLEEDLTVENNFFKLFVVKSGDQDAVIKRGNSGSTQTNLKAVILIS